MPKDPKPRPVQDRTPRTSLTASQRSAVAAFANTQKARQAVNDVRLPELDELRAAALAQCLELGVSNAWLAQESGLTPPRISQMIRDIGGRPELRRRMVPEETP